MRSEILSFLVAALVLNVSSSSAEVIGEIMGVTAGQNGTATLSGWACETGSTSPPNVRVTFGKPAPAGVALYSVPANQPTSASLSAKCGANQKPQGFQITLTARDVTRFSDQKIFAYAASQSDNSNGSELGGSAKFKLPSLSYDVVDCRNWNGVVDRNIRLQPANCQINKPILFAKPDLSLDCNGATIDGTGLTPAPGSRGQGVGLLSAKSSCERSDLVGAASRFPDADGSGSLVKNCRITSFSFGVYFNRRVWTKPQQNAQCVALPEFSEQNVKKAATLDLNAALGGRLKRYGFNPSDVTLRNVEAIRIKDSGIFVNEYAQNWLIEDSRMIGNSVGIYLERESRANRIITSTITDNSNVGIAIDASANNLIEKNVIQANGAVGIALYKNCGESNGVTRYQHTDNNILRHNIVRAQGGAKLKDMTLTLSYLLSSPAGSRLSKPGVGVWIASRQGLSRNWMERVARNDNAVCSDQGYDIKGQTFYGDHASSNQLIENTIDSNSLADVIVEDDNNKLIRNNLSGHGVAPLAGIVVGSIFRQQDPSLGPVKNVVLQDNVMPTSTLGNPVLFIGGSTAQK